MVMVAGVGMAGRETQWMFWTGEYVTTYTNNISFTIFEFVTLNLTLGMFVTSGSSSEIKKTLNLFNG